MRLLLCLLLFLLPLLVLLLLLFLPQPLTGAATHFMRKYLRVIVLQTIGLMFGAIPYICARNGLALYAVPIDFLSWAMMLYSS